MKNKSVIIAAALSILLLISIAAGILLKPKAINGEKSIVTGKFDKLPNVAKERKDTLIVASPSWSGNFNPLFDSTTYDMWASTLIFDSGLMTNDENGKAITWMADSYEISKDRKKFTFYINKNITFSNGNKVTANDFLLTYLALADPKYDGPRIDAVENLVGYKEFHNGKASELAGVKIIDEYTIQFVEKSVKASALLQDFSYPPLDYTIYHFKKGDVAKLKTLSNNPIGAGAYKFVENKSGDHITYVRNDSYWRGTPKIKSLIIKQVSANEHIKALMNGEFDIDCVVPCKMENIETLKNLGFLNIYFYPANSYGYIGMNLRNPKFSDKRVRQALMYGLNRKKFVKEYYNGIGEVCNAPVSKLSMAYTDNVNQYEYDPTKAAKLLTDAGWLLGKEGYRYKNGKKFTIHWMTYTDNAYVKALMPIAISNYRDIGVEIIPEYMEFSTMADKIFQTRNFEMYNMAWNLAIDPDPSGIFSKSQDVPGGGNSVGWSNSENDKLIKAGLLELDPEKRKAIYQKWVMLANEELPYLFLTQGKSMYAVTSRVKGLNIGAYWDWTYNIEKLELIE
jgi:peptide/nickel transport system substrate-binding protein